MHVHRPLLITALLAVPVALAQDTTGGGPGTLQTVNPAPNSTGSTTTPPGGSGTERFPDASRVPGQPLTPPTSSANGTTPSPEMILVDLHLANQSEVELGNLAQQKAQNQEVKRFAAHMVKAHTGMDRDAQAWAKKNHVTIPQAPPQDDSHQAELQKTQSTRQQLEGLAGPAFDRAYMQAMAEDHANDLQKVTAFEQQTENQSLKELLTKAREEIASHKKDADRLVQKLGATAAR